MGTILDEIAAKRRIAVEEKKMQRVLPDLDSSGGFRDAVSKRPGGKVRPLFRLRRTDASREFLAGLNSVPEKENRRAAIIAECKKASPSKGIMLSSYEPGLLAQAYASGGATAVSVLTEPEYFLGNEEHLAEVRRAVALPVLRKDFIIDPWQVDESFVLGADVILLIAALLDHEAISRMAGRARQLGMEVLLEVRDAEELAHIRDLAGLVDAIGVNARDLRDFTVDSGRLHALSNDMPQGPVPVAESGLCKADDACQLYRAGFQAFLIGEHFACSDDPEVAVRVFRTSLDQEMVQYGHWGG